MSFPRYGKYNAKKVKASFKGELVTFDSTKEYKRAIDLLLLEKAGKITDLKTQVPFVIIDKSEWGPAVRYYADFTYYENGEYVVEDVKGVKTDVYKIKSRLMKERNHIVIRES